MRVSSGHQHSAVTFRWHNGTKPVRLIQGHEGSYLTQVRAALYGRIRFLFNTFSHDTILPLRTQRPSSVPSPLAVSLQLLTPSSQRTSPSALLLLARTLYLKNLQSPNLPTWTLCPPGLHRAGLLCCYTELLFTSCLQTSISLVLKSPQCDSKNIITISRNRTKKSFCCFSV